MDQTNLTLLLSPLSSASKPQTSQAGSSGVNPGLRLEDLLAASPKRPASHGSSGLSGALQGATQHVASLIPTFVQLKCQILNDLERNLSGLLSLNVSRREAVAQYLDRLADQSAAPSTLSGNLDAAGGLRRWIEGSRTPAQNSALQCYFEEIALTTLGQALLLKSWSDCGIRAFSERDLAHLNWVLNTALKPHVPLDRESWQIAKQNIYSWYKPSAEIQKNIWETFKNWKIDQEGPVFLITLLSSARQARAENSDPQGYDPRFYQSLWQQMPAFGFNPAAIPGPIKRNAVVFSPTLRDGTVARSGPLSVSWIGLESSSYQIMVAELMQLWRGPSAPPLWAIGSGLEVHTRDQLLLNLGSPKPSLISRIAEMEACDAAFVLEERSIRAQGRSPEAQRLREQLDCLPYFKKLKSPGTSLGDLQACVALSKLRPGGLLWWAREEPLCETDGREALNFLLERAKFVCEWDFSELHHSLPGSTPLFPKHLYLLQRESRVEERLTYRPLRLALTGQIRSHVEVPIVLQDALAAAHGSAQKSGEARGPWQVHSHRSPTPQRDWAERWPDPASQVALRNLEKLRHVSLPLATGTTIRPTPDGDPARGHRWFLAEELKGFWIESCLDAAEGRKLVAHPLPHNQESSVAGTGFIILTANEDWIAPLSRHLESASVRNWLDHHAERKGDRWTLNEQVIKCIPVPKVLFQTLGLTHDLETADHSSSCAVPIRRGSVDAELAAVLEKPDTLNSFLASLPNDERRTQMRTALFTLISWELEKLAKTQGTFASLITESGRVRWGELLKMLPQTECIAVSMHPRVSIAGNLPLHMAIARIERVKTPSPAIFFATEAGFHLTLSAESPTLLEMVWEQVEGLTSPTWSELVSFIKLPRRMELAEATATDVLKMHGMQSRRITQLTSLLADCPVL